MFNVKNTPALLLFNGAQQGKSGCSYQPLPMMSRTIACITAALFMVGCSGGSPGGDSADSEASAPPAAGDVVAARSFDMSIPSRANRQDGSGEVNISMTVFIPEHTEGESYPLVLHSHGFGGSRVGIAEADADPASPADRSSTDSIFGRLDDQVRLLWDDGYAVVSFDERGFGRGDDGDAGNSGLIQAMDPEFEIQDAISVLDWAEANLNITEGANGDTRIGAIGGSYGGAYQLLLAALDDRVDAITPTATWYNLLEALTPNRVIKKGFGTGLCVVITADNAEAGDRTMSACNQASDTMPANRYQEDIIVNTDEIIDLFGSHGMNRIEERHEDANDDFRMRPIDALFIQGNRDILFNLTQATNNYHFLNDLDGDVRLMTMENGHSLRQTRQLGGSQLPLGVNTCGPLDVLASVRAWLDLKLRNNVAAENMLPNEVCISLANDVAVNLDSLPVASTAAFDAFVVSIPSTAITAAQNNVQSEAGGTFIPLAAAITGSSSVLAGLPVANLTISDTVVDARGGTTLFVGIGIRRAGSIFLVDQQVEPLRANDERTGETPLAIELVGVAEPLQDGDEVGVLLYGSFDQYEPTPGTPANFNANNNVTVSGEVRLPIFDAEVQTFNASSE